MTMLLWQKLNWNIRIKTSLMYSIQWQVRIIDLLVKFISSLLHLGG